MRISDWSSDVCSSDLSVMDADGARAASEGLFKLVWSRRPLWTVLLTGGAAAKLREELLRICRSEEHTSELQSLMRISYAVFCLKKNKQRLTHTQLITTNV